MVNDSTNPLKVPGTYDGFSYTVGLDKIQGSPNVESEITSNIFENQFEIKEESQFPKNKASQRFHIDSKETRKKNSGSNESGKSDLR
jgi:hypothetical protein